MDVLPVSALEPPEEEALDDLAQSVLRLCRREQDGRGWLRVSKAALASGWRNLPAQVEQLFGASL